MPRIQLSTLINAPIERCFDLSTSIDLHLTSAEQTKEKVIAGRKTGLIKLGETVTWRAKHFGLWHKLTVKITAYERPHYFVDEMLEGSFKFMRHKHEFIANEKGTLMKCTFDFKSPFGVIGKLVDSLFLQKYMTQFLRKRNEVIKQYAEDDGLWKDVL